MTATDIQMAFTLAGLVMRLVEQGALTGTKLRAIFAEAGATPEELADLDRRLSDAIARREAANS